MKKKFIGMVFAVAILTTLLPTLFISAYAADGTDAVVNAETIITEGTCGDNLTWTLNEDGLLAIFGEGEMADYSSGSQPWYSYVEQIKKVYIEDSVTSIGQYAFWNCKYLEEVYMGAGVTSIGSYSFYRCTSLTTITLPDNLTSIGSEAFSNAPIGVVNIPNSVTAVSSAVYSLTTITSFVVTDTDEVGYRSDDDVLYYYNENNNDLCLVKFPLAKQITGTYEILNGTKSIGEKAFYSIKTLETIDIPRTVTSIGKNAFDGCTHLTAITLHDGLGTIGDYAFQKCSALITVEIPDSVTSIGVHAFNNCTNLEEVYMGACLTNLGTGAFYQCTSLTTITLPDNLRTIGGNVFHNAPVSVVYIPNSVITVSNAIYNLTTITSFVVTDTDTVGYRSVDGVLYHCADYTEELSLIRYPQSKQITETYEILNGTTSIGEKAFHGIKTLETIEIPKTVKSFGYDAFSECTSLTTITLHDGLETIGGNAFMECSALKTVEIPDSVTSIGTSAFKKCTNLEEVYMGAGVTSIAVSAFGECKSLTTITIPDRLTSFGSSSFSNAPISVVNIPNSVTTVDRTIYNLPTITSFNVTDTDSVGYRSVDGVLYYYNEDTEELILIGFPQSKIISGTYEILDGTNVINEYAFNSLKTLETIDIPETVTSISNHAFISCRNLTTLTLHDGLETIGEFAFQRCVALKTVEIPDSVTSIGANAFQECTNLEEVYMGAGVKNIGSSAFSSCKSLTTLTLHDGLETIGERAFCLCSVLKTVEIPDSVTSIGESAFWDCKLLEEVYIGAGVTSIGYESFIGCNNLKAAYFFGDRPMNFGSRAFNGTASDFKIYYIEGNPDWTTPTWNGYNTATFIPADTNVAVDGVTLNKSSAILEIGETLTLTATVSPSDATNKAVIWTSTNSSIAKVSNGTITALSAGTATITVTTADGGYAAQCVVTVNAAEALPENSGEITVTNISGSAGSTVKVPVSITANPGFVSMILKVSYDPSILTLIAVEDTGLIPGSMHTTKYTSPYTLTWENDMISENITVSGTVVYLTFQIAESAENGTYPITVATPQDGIFNYDLENVPFRFVSGEVTVRDFIYGDVNRDGDVTSLDRIVLSRALAEWDGYDLSMIDSQAADVNGDTYVTSKDRIILARHIADWTGYETLPRLD